MPIAISLKDDFTALERSLQRVGDKHMKFAIALALTRTAIQARGEVISDLSKIFDRPTPFTVRSIRYKLAKPGDRTAEVYISDDAAKGLSPHKYLSAEIEGGSRGDKRSERALLMKGMMQPGMRMMPGSAMKLDKYGNIPGSRMVQILSRIAAFGEQGYRANASEATKRKLEKRKLAVRSTRTDYFVAKSKQDGAPLGVYQILSKGVVRPVLFFARRAPDYKVKFPFTAMVERSARASFRAHLMQALQDEIATRK